MNELIDVALAGKTAEERFALSPPQPVTVAVIFLIDTGKTQSRSL